MPIPSYCYDLLLLRSTITSGAYHVNINRQKYNTKQANTTHKQAFTKKITWNWGPCPGTAMYNPPPPNTHTTPSLAAFISRNLPKKCVLLCRANFKHRKILPHEPSYPIPSQNMSKPLRDFFLH